jgi:hypothetical protein
MADFKHECIAIIEGEFITCIWKEQFTHAMCEHTHTRMQTPHHMYQRDTTTYTTPCKTLCVVKNSTTSSLPCFHTCALKVVHTDTCMQKWGYTSGNTLKPNALTRSWLHSCGLCSEQDTCRIRHQPTSVVHRQLLAAQTRTNRSVPHS